MHGGTFAVYGECPARGDAFIGGVIHKKPHIMFIRPPAKEGFFCILRNHSIVPRHCISLSSEDRNTFIYIIYLLPLLSHRKSPETP